MLGRFGAWRSSHNLLGCKVQLDMITYTTAINACETANWQDALGLLVASSQSFSSQDLIAISAAANTLGSRGRWLEVVELLEGGAPVDATAQNIQLSACEKGQEWCQAMDRFQLAAWRGLSSNAICYHATMSACGAREKWQHVLQLFDAFGAQQLQTNIVTYGALLSGLESAAQGSAGSGVRWRQTQEVLCDLYQNQLEINLICTNAAMSACEKGAQWPMASLLLDSLEAVYVETSRISQSSAFWMDYRSSRSSREC
ncbi:Pentatricopeptide repeat-containing protein At1g74850 [Durusdinium trenchii]|uniref:Chloroplastic (Protein PLASTID TRANSCRIPTIONALLY ACTIVE 2) n=1 Tax=Durusdinium trenchii TaxID=1381693 RepID=A0ABP0RSD9_9DINO